MVLALVPLSNRLLARDREDDPDASPALPPDLAALLAAVMLNSNAALRGHRWGQLCALTAFAVMMALRARQLGRPARAGAWLAVAAFKPATALPFLVLFLRRADRRAWAACAAVSLGLTAVAAPPSAWASLFRNNLRQIAEAGEPGKINDYGFGRDISADMVALNQLFHRVGLRDRALISALQSAGAAGVLALALAVRNRRPFAAAASLAACGSMLFLYHRAYDAVVLALPAAYAASLAVHSTGRRRGVAVASVGLLLSVVCQPREALIGLTSWSLDRGAIGRVMQALVLPYATWALLLATAGLAVLTFAPAPAPVTPPSPAPTRRAGRPDPVMSARS